MSLTVVIRLPSSAFELGRALSVQTGERIELETMVPLGAAAIPFFWLYHSGENAFVSAANDHPSVRNIATVDTFDDRTLFALDWDPEADGLFDTIVDCRGRVLDATGAHDEWRLELRFPSHDELSAFRSACQDEQYPLTVERVSRADGSTAKTKFGLTAIQRETLLVAVEAGYYDIPRRCTTVELAEMLDISDQAVTERLRRAIVSLVSNTLVTARENT
ncbi:DNA binding protein [Halogeometricum borinquense DSM 11551]|uniref:DNA binding protein n=1 Tax=Halogeometricum borinquense (strain ATCC 700274 / DSM 11551 / JCM 10706 / KCTC 4070 / PR3) TaxID=469382 RepID=E4NRY9_HALBP|nr:helix-turn-helix domain-containing protein [Halogeometricum borinquense]ADQ68035.1 predicted DNA binding protein [Halogeometricum borinquense DSM 11551]ELY24407.1 DNA binding protein [Halogeometricum borinquense DSM 11551]